MQWARTFFRLFVRISSRVTSGRMTFLLFTGARFWRGPPSLHTDVRVRGLHPALQAIVAGDLKDLGILFFADLAHNRTGFSLFFFFFQAEGRGGVHFATVTCRASGRCFSNKSCRSRSSADHSLFSCCNSMTSFVWFIATSFSSMRSWIAATVWMVFSTTEDIQRLTPFLAVVRVVVAAVASSSLSLSWSRYSLMMSPIFVSILYASSTCRADLTEPAP